MAYKPDCVACGSDGLIYMASSKEGILNQCVKAYQTGARTQAWVAQTAKGRRIIGGDWQWSVDLLRANK